MMNNKNLVFTPLEAAVIRKFDISGLVFKPELSLSFGMTPSEVNLIVKKLQDDGIIDDFSEMLLKLTKKGREAQNLLDNNDNNDEVKHDSN